MKGHWYEFTSFWFQLWSLASERFQEKSCKRRNLLSPCCWWIFLEWIKEHGFRFCKPNHGIRNREPPPLPPPPPPLSNNPEKQRNAGAASWVIDAPCSTIESIQESTIGPIDCNLATPSLQFPGFWESQGISLLFPSIQETKRRLLGAELSWEAQQLPNSLAFKTWKKTSSWKSKKAGKYLKWN